MFSHIDLSANLITSSHSDSCVSWHL